MDESHQVSLVGWLCVKTKAMSLHRDCYVAGGRLWVCRYYAWNKCGKAELNAKKPLLNIRLEGEQDVIIVRRRTRQIAQLLSMSESDQTKMPTVASEVSRNAIQFAKKAKVVFFIDDATRPFFWVSIEDKGPGIDDVDRYLEGQVSHRFGLFGARRMVDRFDVDISENGTLIYLRKVLHSRVQAFTTQEVSEISTSLGKFSKQGIASYSWRAATQAGTAWWFTVQRARIECFAWESSPGKN